MAQSIDDNGNRYMGWNNSIYPEGFTQGTVTAESTWELAGNSTYRAEEFTMRYTGLTADEIKTKEEIDNGANQGAGFENNAATENKTKITYDISRIDTFPGTTISVEDESIYIRSQITDLYCEISGQKIRNTRVKFAKPTQPPSGSSFKSVGQFQIFRNDNRTLATGSSTCTTFITIYVPQTQKRTTLQYILTGVDESEIETI